MPFLAAIIPALAAAASSAGSAIGAGAGAAGSALGSAAGGLGSALGGAGSALSSALSGSPALSGAAGSIAPASNVAGFTSAAGPATGAATLSGGPIATAPTTGLLGAGGQFGGSGGLLQQALGGFGTQPGITMGANGPQLSPGTPGHGLLGGLQSAGQVSQQLNPVMQLMNQGQGAGDRQTPQQQLSAPTPPIPFAPLEDDRLSFLRAFHLQ